MENKQTAVEWFNDEILIHLNFDQRLYLKKIFEQAKQMEKKQNMGIAKKVWEDMANNDTLTYNTFEEYYNETYGKQ